MKRLTRLLSLLSFSGRPDAQDLWSSPEPMKKWVTSYGLAQNDSSLSIVHGLVSNIYKLQKFFKEILLCGLSLWSTLDKRMQQKLG